MKKAILTFLLFIPLNIYAKVYLYQQWHLLGKIKTQDIEKSKGLPQYTNQKFIFTHIDNLIAKNKLEIVIAEGCQGKIDENFLTSFNGWNYQSLLKFTEKKEYADILGHIPLKLEAKYKERLLSLCGDDEKLIQDHGMAFSNARAFIGYYTRLKEFKKKKDQKRFKLYADSMLDGKTIQDPVGYAREEAKKNLNQVKKLIHQRNQSFLRVIETHKDKNLAVVIGGLHLDHLEGLIKKSKIDYEIVPVTGIPKDSKKLFERLEQSLQ